MIFMFRLWVRRFRRAMLIMLRNWAHIFCASGYGCNHAVFLSECDHEANEYTIWTWGSLAKAWLSLVTLCGKSLFCLVLVFVPVFGSLHFLGGFRRARNLCETDAWDLVGLSYISTWLPHSPWQLCARLEHWSSLSLGSFWITEKLEYVWICQLFAADIHI